MALRRGTLTDARETIQTKFDLQGYKKKKRKKLLLALLFRTHAVHRFLQDLDVGDVVLAQ